MEIPYKNFFNIKSDISIFGKAVGGGLPIGLIAISKEIEKHLLKKKTRFFFGGTFSGNSMVSYVGMSVFDFIQKNKKEIFKKLNYLSSKFEKI